MSHDHDHDHDHASPQGRAVLVVMVVVVGSALGFRDDPPQKWGGDWAPYRCLGGIEGDIIISSFKLRAMAKIIPRLFSKICFPQRISDSKT